MGAEREEKDKLREKDWEKGKREKGGREEEKGGRAEGKLGTGRSGREAGGGPYEVLERQRKEGRGGRGRKE